MLPDIAFEATHGRLKRFVTSLAARYDMDGIDLRGRLDRESRIVEMEL